MRDLSGLRDRFTSTEEVILLRRSVRVYGKEQVPEFLVRRILEAGRSAPSAGNRQPWKFIVVRDPKILDDLTRDVVSVALRLKDHPDNRALTALAEGRLRVFHGAPTVLLILKDVREGSNPDLDCGIAGQNMVHSAHSMGLGTCWVSFTKLAFQYTDAWNRFFGIEPPYEFLSSIAVGWPGAESYEAVGRQSDAIDCYDDGGRKSVD
jgi:nitroreductase